MGCTDSKEIIQHEKNQYIHLKDQPLTISRQFTNKNEILIGEKNYNALDLNSYLFLNLEIIQIFDERKNKHQVENPEDQNQNQKQTGDFFRVITKINLEQQKLYSIGSAENANIILQKLEFTHAQIKFYQQKYFISDISTLANIGFQILPSGIIRHYSQLKNEIIYFNTPHYKTIYMLLIQAITFSQQSKKFTITYSHGETLEIAQNSGNTANIQLERNQIISIGTSDKCEIQLDKNIQGINQQHLLIKIFENFPGDPLNLSLVNFFQPVEFNQSPISFFSFKNLNQIQNNIKSNEYSLDENIIFKIGPYLLKSQIEDIQTINQNQ